MGSFDVCNQKLRQIELGSYWGFCHRKIKLRPPQQLGCTSKSLTGDVGSTLSVSEIPKTLPQTCVPLSALCITCCAFPTFDGLQSANFGDRPQRVSFRAFDSKELNGRRPKPSSSPLPLRSNIPKGLLWESTNEMGKVRLSRTFW